MVPGHSIEVDGAQDSIDLDQVIKLYGLLNNCAPLSCCFWTGRDSNLSSVQIVTKHTATILHGVCTFLNISVFRMEIQKLCHSSSCCTPELQSGFQTLKDEVMALLFLGIIPCWCSPKEVLLSVPARAGCSFIPPMLVLLLWSLTHPLYWCCAET